MYPRKNKILIIDDEEDFCYFLKANLKLLGNYDVLVETSGKSGIRTAHRNKPDIILLDILMPGINGLEVLNRLKKGKKTMRIPVIMLTAKNDDESKIEAAGLFCEDYVVKPIRVRVLESKVKRVLSLIQPRT